jgi:hypothetical protein
MFSITWRPHPPKSGGIQPLTTARPDQFQFRGSCSRRHSHGSSKRPDPIYVSAARWSLRSALLLAPSTHSERISIPGIGQVVGPQSPCAQTVVTSFLADPGTPDTSCVGTLKPPTFHSSLTQKSLFKCSEQQSSARGIAIIGHAPLWSGRAGPRGCRLEGALTSSENKPCAISASDS